MKAFKKIQKDFNKQSDAVAGNIKKTTNLVKSVVKNPKEFVDKVKFGNYKELPFSFREKLNQIGDQTITSLEIIRQPISNALMTLMDGLSGFTLKQKLKETPYDKLFHLKLRINNSYDLEKEANVKLASKSDKKGQESLLISEIPNMCIRDFIENTINKININNFTHYSGDKLNCQNFVLNLLHANKINNNIFDSFIKQDTEFVFKNNPNPLFKKIMDTATDLGERVNTLTEGTGLGRKMKSKTTLTNFDIANICKIIQLPLNGIFMKDEITLDNLKNGNYIMNLQNHNQDGSHWCCFIKRSKIINYFDPFGIVPPENEVNLFHANHDTLYYNKTQIQDVKSKCCGWFCIAFLRYMAINNSYGLKKADGFIKQFDLINRKKNDKICKNIANHYIKDE
jgi:hypothetical protein